MSAPAQAAPSPTSRSFAGMLADFATPAKKFPPARDLDGLADDIATLTYEHALKTHARYHPFPDHAVSPEAQPSQPASPGSSPLFTPGSGDLAPQETASQDPKSENSVSPSGLSADAASRKAASVTVRLTRAEDERLRQRAAEAGLTISAYLRSCAFEVETLRAQVKQTIAEMRHADPTPPPPPQPERMSSFSRLFPWRKRAAAPAA
jgi:predicted DNA binding CopG/RHH family protein